LVLEFTVADNSLVLEAVFFNENRWYEIDTIEDLISANKLYNQIRQTP